MNNLQLISNFPTLTLSNDALNRIESNMPEITRALQSFGRTNSQTTAKLMSLTMLTSGSPYRVLRQCLAEIQKRQAALEETMFNLREAQLKAELLKRNPNDPLALLQAEREESKIYNSKLAIEGALKDIASFQEAYNQVRINNNIREDWDENDFEQAEVKHHTRTAFLHAYRDVMAHGLLNMGTLEYLHQFGIHPHAAFNEARLYINNLEQSSESVLDTSHLEIWLNEMVQKYSNSYQVAMKYLGLDELYTNWAMYRTISTKITE